MHIIRQKWLDLSFLHWAVEPAAVAHYFPPGTRPDTFEGRTYVGLVPFRMVMLRSFLETNIRLYSVDTAGRQGVVFLSLDANWLPLVVGSRATLGIPYRWARMQHQQDGGWHTYTSTLLRPHSKASSKIETQVGERLEPGPLEHFLTARWGLHLHRAGRTWYMPTEHPPWVLHRAELMGFEDRGLFASVGLGELSRRPPDHVAFSAGVPARFGLPRGPVLP
ncbi:YqjF family protein [Kribbella sp. CA-294648]|uniref:YqjF family protein n=1 Tax=Kribbella sp. CA-294648 TaxID=3239948 RepID=UPI003D8F7403